jgi:hypothetical protein
MEDANMEDAPLQIESGPHDIDMEAAVQSDPLELLMKALPAQDSAMLQILLPMSIQECEPLIGETRSLNDLNSLRTMLTVVHTIIYKYRQSHATLPDGCEVWRSLSEVPSLDSWYGTKKPIKVLGSPGLTVASLLDQLAKASRSKLEVKHDVNPDQRAKDFSKQFLGQGVHYLHRHILGVRKAFDYHTHYAPIIPIIQSSGTGKSKTAVQLAQLELGFFTCVRKQSKNVSEPRGDDQVAPWLNSPRQVESAESRDADVDKAGSNHLARSPQRLSKRKRIGNTDMLIAWRCGYCSSQRNFPSITGRSGSHYTGRKLKTPLTSPHHSRWNDGTGSKTPSPWSFRQFRAEHQREWLYWHR